MLSTQNWKTCVFFWAFFCPWPFLTRGVSDPFGTKPMSCTNLEAISRRSQKGTKIQRNERIFGTNLTATTGSRNSCTGFRLSEILPPTAQQVWTFMLNAILCSRFEPSCWTQYCTAGLNLHAERNIVQQVWTFMLNAVLCWPKTNLRLCCGQNQFSEIGPILWPGKSTQLDLFPA